jgi:hypothetical protein
MGEQFLTEKEVAAITRMALSTLRNDRSRGRGIPYCKIGSSVRYPGKDVEKFMLIHRIVPGAKG